MLQAIERIGHAIQTIRSPAKEDKGVSVPLPPKPDAIIEEGHPLQFYPGFSEYVNVWNERASSSTRLDLQAAIQLSQLETGELEHQTTPLQLKVQDRRKAQKILRETFETNPPVPKDIQKRTIRDLRRDQESANREFQQKERERKAAQARLETATKALAQFDDQFVYGLDKDEVRFYIVERLRNSLDDYDDFLLRYFTRKKITLEYGLENELNSINFHCFNLAMYYDGPSEIKVNNQKFWEATYKATARQLEKRGTIKHEAQSRQKRTVKL
ncbi:hypothetical protein MUP56_00495 [Patescibacteria group bacterium]|nr:hypothetical protein [Patescibacteria group bacterium]